MSATLTVDVDTGTLELAEQEARARHTTVPEVVAHLQAFVFTSDPHFDLVPGLKRHP